MNPRENGEEAPLNDAKDLAWTIWDARVITSSMSCIGGVIMGTFFYPAIMPALEADASFGWQKRDTMQLASTGILCVTAGLLIAGPVVDYVSPTKLITFHALVVCAVLICFSMDGTKSVIFLLVGTATFFKGLLWPSFNHVLAGNIAPSKQDVAFLAASMGSRLGDVASAAIIGWAMTSFGSQWHEAVAVLLIFVILSFAVAIVLVPGSLKEHGGSKHPSLDGFAQKWARLIWSIDAWLVFAASLGTFSVWAMYDYLAVIMRDMHGLTPGEAASSTVWLSIGSAAGLLAAFMSSSTLGTEAGRAAHVLQSCVALVALLILSGQHVSLGWNKVMLCMIGFGFVVNSYMPFLLFGANSSPDERGFRTAMMEGGTTLLAIGYTVGYGYLRTPGQDSGLHMGTMWIYRITAASMSVSTLAMCLFYQRLNARVGEARVSA